MAIDAKLGLVALFLFLAGKKSAKASVYPNAPNDNALLNRANQKTALDWIPTFVDQGRTEHEAAAYARWAGIESGGNPLAVSPLGERGLFQCMPSTALVDKAMRPEDWAATQRPQTTRREHARIAAALLSWCLVRAMRKVRNPPNDPQSRIWYAKMYHSRPADFNGQIMHGPALLMARQLENEWKGRPKSLYRLHVANVIAFGTPNP